MVTVPVPVNVKAMPPVPADGPNMKAMDPVDESAVIMTGVPSKLGILDCVAVPESVTVLRDKEPVSGN
jgi:hypothetical protein